MNIAIKVFYKNIAKRIKFCNNLDSLHDIIKKIFNLSEYQFSKIVILIQIIDKKYIVNNLIHYNYMLEFAYITKLKSLKFYLIEKSLVNQDNSIKFFEKINIKDNYIYNRINLINKDNYLSLTNDSSFKKSFTTNNDESMILCNELNQVNLNFFNKSLKIEIDKFEIENNNNIVTRNKAFNKSKLIKLENISKELTKIIDKKLSYLKTNFLKKLLSTNISKSFLDKNNVINNSIYKSSILFKAKCSICFCENLFQYIYYCLNEKCINLRFCLNCEPDHINTNNNTHMLFKCFKYQDKHPFYDKLKNFSNKDTEDLQKKDKANCNKLKNVHYNYNVELINSNNKVCNKLHHKIKTKEISNNVYLQEDTLINRSLENNKNTILLRTNRNSFSINSKINIKENEKLLFNNSINSKFLGIYKELLVKTGKNITKSIKVKNTGNINWPKGSELVCIENISLVKGIGNRLCIKTEPMKEINIEITLDTSKYKPGSYNSYWQMKNDTGIFFGDVLEINVVIV